MPKIPMADLPPLPVLNKTSHLPRSLVSSSPKGLSSISFPSSSSSSSSSPVKSPAKPLITDSPTKSPTKRAFVVPFPMTPSSRSTTPAGTPVKNSIHFPQTPTTTRSRGLPPLPPRTPTTSLRKSDELPSTPVHQKGPDADTAPPTPSTSRRAAIYERIRQKSLTTSPTKPGAIKGLPGVSQSREQMLKLGQEEMRRRCLLGRLDGIAESVWM
jgi:hypothetical protein